MTQLVGVARIAEMLDLNEDHVRDRLSKRRDFPRAFRVAGALRWRLDEIEEWIDSRRLSPAARKTKSRKESGCVDEAVR